MADILEDVQISSRSLGAFALDLAGKLLTGLAIGLGIAVGMAIAG